MDQLHAAIKAFMTERIAKTAAADIATADVPVTSATPTTTNSLLTLPTELRLQIYGYVLTTSTIETPTKVIIFPGITRTCRLIRSEALDLYRLHLQAAAVSLGLRIAQLNYKIWHAVQMARVNDICEEDWLGRKLAKRERCDPRSLYPGDEEEKVKLERWYAQVETLSEELAVCA